MATLREKLAQCENERDNHLICLRETVARIADLERQLSTEHICHNQCDRPLCVTDRRVRELEAVLVRLQVILDEAQSEGWQHIPTNWLRDTIGTVK